MKVYTNTTDFIISDNTAVAIGKFDGSHLGHKLIFDTLIEMAKKYSLKTAVFTFYQSPNSILKKSSSREIMTNDERRKKFEALGIDYLIEYPFTDEISHMQGDDFLREVLIKNLGMKVIVAGTDCAFGYQKSGNADMLKAHEEEYGYKSIIIEKKKDDDRDISSTYIKELLSLGDVAKAKTLLGRAYSISGIVEHGNSLGAGAVGYPTANIIPDEHKYLPANGVYATRVYLDDGRAYRAITNIGNNPSVKSDRLEHIKRVESYLLDFDGCIYDSRINVEFDFFIREEKKFDDLKELGAQISKDIEIVRRENICM